MSKCIDPKIGNLLAAYEAGMLDDAEREQFELHALECRWCNQQLQEFSRGARLLRSDRQIHEVIAEVDSSAASDKRPGRRLVPALLAAAAVVIFLILQPWRIEFHTTDTATAAGNRLAVMYFDNLAEPADSARLGQIATHLLITDLSESQFIDVVSSQRLFDALKVLGREDARTVDKEIASEVAVKVDARWMLLGSILQVEPHLELASQLVEVNSGDVIGSQRITGDESEDIFALVDRLSALVKNDLTLPREAMQEPDPLVAEVTTNSREAYRYYLEGLENYYRLYYPEAAENFEKAVEYDSTFAMAYYYLSKLKSRRYVAKAVEYAAGASQKEQAYISVLEATAAGDADRVITELKQLVTKYPDEKDALLQLGRYTASRERYDEAIGYLKRAVEADPLYKLGYNLLAYCYSQTGEFEQALRAIDRYIELAPDEPNPYATRGDILARDGRIDEAINSLNQAVSLKRDFADYRILLTLGQMYVLKGEYDSAGTIFQEMASGDSKRARSQARTGMSLVLLRQGRLSEADKMLDDGITADRLEQATSGAAGDRAYKHFIKAFIAREQGDYGRAVDQMRECIEIHNQAYPGNWHAYRYLLAQVLAEAGQYNEAEQVAETLKVKLEEVDQSPADAWYALGCVRLAQGKTGEAIELLRQSAARNDNFYAQYMYGRALLEAGQASEAVEAFSKALHNYVGMRASFMIWSVKTRYYLGLAHEQSGQYQEAAERYEEFLAIWAESEPRPPELDDADARLNRIRNRP